MFKLFLFYVPFLVGFIFAQILEPCIRLFMSKFKISRKTSSIIIVFIFFILLVLIFLLGSTFIISEISNLLSNFNEYLNAITRNITIFTEYINIKNLSFNSEIKNILNNTTIDFINAIAKTIKSFLNKFLTVITSLPKIFVYIIITILATYFICSDKFYILDQMEYHFPKSWVAKIRENAKNITNSLGLYLRAEILMILISFSIVLIRIKYILFSRVKCSISSSNGCNYRLCG